jgi:hypothetical protein
MTNETDNYANQRKTLNVLSYANGEKKVNGSYVTVIDNGSQYKLPLADVAKVLGVPSDANPEMEVTLRLMDIGRPRTAKPLSSYGSQIERPESPQRLQKDSPVRYIV